MADLKSSKLLGRAVGTEKKVLNSTYGYGSFDIDKFRSQLFTGVSHVNHFRVLFSSPRIFQLGVTDSGDSNSIAQSAINAAVDAVNSKISQVAPGLQIGKLNVSDFIGAPLTFMCYGATIPGKQVTHVEYRDSGPIRKIPNGYTVDDLTLSFYTRISMPERYLFEAWINLITGNLVTLNGPPKNRYAMKFYDDVHTSIILEKWSPDGNPEYAYKFVEAYPVSIQEIPLSWEANSEMVKFNVTFAYRDWVGMPIPVDLAVNSAEALLNKIHL